VSVRCHARESLQTSVSECSSRDKTNKSCSPSHVLRGGDDHDDHDCRETEEADNVERTVSQSVINPNLNCSVVPFPPAHDVRSGLASAVSPDSGSASGAVLDDDAGCAHACRSSGEAGDDVERPLLQSSIQGAVRVLSTPPPPPFEVRDSTLRNNTLITPDLTNSALHDFNSDNKSPSGVGGSGVFSFSSGAVTKPFLAINSNTVNDHYTAPACSPLNGKRVSACTDANDSDPAFP